MQYSQFLIFISEHIKQIDFTNHNAEPIRIFEHITGKRVYDTILLDDAVDEQYISAATSIIDKRKTGMPLAYILGYEYFYGYKINVTNAVLIPRHDSETPVREAIDLCRSGDRVIDLCCGSGCLGLVIAKNCKLSSLTLLDISNEALKIAQKNAISLGVDPVFVNLSISDTASIAELLNNHDIIISNPPYISQSVFEDLDPQVKNFEPSMALVAGSTGVMFYEMIAEAIKCSNKKSRYIVLEIGHNMAKQVKDILKPYQVKTIKDIAGRDRALVVKLQD